MAKKLTDVAIKARTEPGRLGDGEVSGLYLSVTAAKSGKVSRAFVYRFTSPVTKKIREAGLGSYPEVSLADARETAKAFAKLKASGKDPLIERDRERAEAAAAALAKESAKTFRQVAESLIDHLIEQDRAAGGKFETTTVKDWRSTLARFVYPKIGHLNIGEVKFTHIAGILKPLSLSKGKTAREGCGGPTVAASLRSRLERIFEWSIVHGWREEDTPNPARPGLFKEVLPKGRKIKNHRSAPLDSAPAIWARLAQEDDTTANAIRFIMATGVRLREALDAKWGEIDFETNTFTIPAKRMKTGTAHVVPLSAPALAILDQQKARRTGGHVFPGRLAGSPLASVSPSSRLRQIGLGEATSLHGFRSNLMDFVTEHFDRELAELSLAHKIGTEVTAAYLKTTLLSKRRIAMDAYGKFLTTGEKPKAEGEGDNVVPFAKAAGGAK